MRLVITDTPEGKRFCRAGDLLLEPGETVRPCVGCFGCWIKTPGACVLPDRLKDMGKTLAQCDELVLISRCAYGGLSPFVKNVMDRSISYIHPNFVIRGGEMHHKRRYDNRLTISAFFYGPEITEEEKITARELVQANAVNFDGAVRRVDFFERAEALEGAVL